MYSRKLAAVLLVAWHSAAVSADELPKELLLRCEGKTRFTITGTLSREAEFNTLFRLKDG